MALTINEPIKTVNGLLTEALAANSQLLYIITTDIDLNSVNNYRINVEIRDAADTFALFDKVFSYIPNQAGVLDLDVGETVTRYIKDQGLFSFQYFLRVVEVWQGSGESSTDTTILQAILAKKQLLSVGGANMWENLLRVGTTNNTTPFTSISDQGGFAQVFIAVAGFSVGDIIEIVSTDGIYNDISEVTSIGTGSILLQIAFKGDAIGNVNASKAKFLTKFINPIKWRGWNRTVSVLVDQEYFTRTGLGGIRERQGAYDINKIDAGFLTINTLPNDVNINIIPIAETPQFYTGIRMQDNTGAFITSEELYFQNQNECKNPIMLDWINSLGGVSQWLFETSQSVQIVSDSGIVAERPINTDIEFITRTKQRFANTFRQQLTLRAHNLTFDQLIALQEIKQTESLRVYLSKDGANFIDGIVITTFTTDYNNKRNDHKFIVVIELPDGFIFEEGKLY